MVKNHYHHFDGYISASIQKLNKMNTEKLTEGDHLCYCNFGGHITASIQKLNKKNIEKLTELSIYATATLVGIILHPFRNLY